MTQTNISIREFVKRFKAGEFDSADVTVQISAGWYDWFCKPTSLRNKTRHLGNKVVQLSHSNLFDIDATYVSFKNNCPLYGKLYDSIAICNLENDDVLYWITPNCGHAGDGFGYPEVEVINAVNKTAAGKFENWRAVRKYFGV